MRRFSVRNGSVTLSVLEGGEGPTVLLLHGWPDTSELWDLVAPALVDHGYRVVVPDLRGCGRSSKPADTASYATHVLVSDVQAIIEATGAERVSLVGHDWGSNLAWITAAFAPSSVERLVALSSGHPTAFRSVGIDQMVKSFFVLVFAHEGVGEAFFRKNDYEALRTWLGHPRARAVIDELERDGQMSAHMQWFRANVPPEVLVAQPRKLPLIEVPALGIWSSGDQVLGEEQMTSSKPYCSQGFEYVRFDDVGHWIPIEAAPRLVDELVKFLPSPSPHL